MNKRCKHSDWKIINDREDKDYVCVRDDSWITGYHLCYCDENCRFYEQESEDDKIHYFYPSEEKAEN